MAAAITGDNLAYLFGRLAGRQLIERTARLLHLHAKRLEGMNTYFDRHAGTTITTARWISPLRGLVALSAGAAFVPWRRLLVYNAIGSISWAAAVTGLSYGLSRSLAELAEIFSLAGLTVGGVLILGVVVFFVWRHRRKASQVAARDAEHAGDPEGEPAATVEAAEACTLPARSEATGRVTVSVCEACLGQSDQVCSPVCL